MNPLKRAFNAVGGRLMARSGRVAILGTTGARTGRHREVPVEFVARPDGSILVGAGGKGRGWAANLRADPACTVSIKGRGSTRVAELLAGREREDAIAAFAASLGSAVTDATFADVFALRPVAGSSTAAVPAAGGAAADDTGPATDATPGGAA